MWRADSLEKTLMLGKLRAGGEGNDRGWDGWKALLIQWTWVWVSFRVWWWTGRPGVLWSMWSQTAGHDWATELNWSKKMSLKMVYQALKSKQILDFKNYFENHLAFGSHNQVDDFFHFKDTYWTTIGCSISNVLDTVEYTRKYDSFFTLKFISLGSRGCWENQTILSMTLLIIICV